MNTQHKAVLLSMCCLGFAATAEANQETTSPQEHHQNNAQQYAGYRQINQLPIWQAAYQHESLRLALSSNYHKNRPVVLSWNFPPR